MSLSNFGTLALGAGALISSGCAQKPIIAGALTNDYGYATHYEECTHSFDGEDFMEPEEPSKYGEYLYELKTKIISLEEIGESHRHQVDCILKEIPKSE